ncbi:tetratricopeptide repeat protein [Komagataeibacter intermedius]|uniref:tetratricopeptide repeat protein n=1 Tax=Komagataeibacter intermedius TaxID=66229 RepID=UPI003B433E1F
MDTPPISVVETQLMLGQIHLDHGRLQDAFMMFEAAARSGEPRALNMLGRAYERGWGTACNPAAAAMYFHKAAYAGDPWAAFNLADLYMAGRGVAGDPDRAGDLYAMAARGGVAKALTMLGLLAEDGTCAMVSPRSAPCFSMPPPWGGLLGRPQPGSAASGHRRRPGRSTLDTRGAGTGIWRCVPRHHPPAEWRNGPRAAPAGHAGGRAAGSPAFPPRDRVIIIIWNYR